jgi:uncharacterized protein (TIGR02391 family)
MIHLSTLVSNAADLLALEAEEIAGVLLTHLNTFDANDTGDGSVQHGRINQYNFFLWMDRLREYGERQAEVNQALMEGWAWLQSDGLLIRDGNSSTNSYFLSRRAQKLRSRADFVAYRKAGLLPKGQLHSLIATKVYPAYLRGEYDTAVFQAFREVEVAVRAAGKYPSEAVGTKLMRDAFRPADPSNPNVKSGPLTDVALPVAEQEGMSNLFAGAISLYKNPQSHRNVPTEAADAAEIIVFASHLLGMVDRQKSI